MQGDGVKKGMLPAILILALMAGAGGGYLAGNVQTEGEQQQISKSAVPNFIRMEPFIITLKGDSRSHYLQLKLSLMTRDPEAIQTLEAYTPMVRNELFRYLSVLNHEFVRNPKSADDIREAALERVNGLLSKERAAASVDDLIITDMVVQ